MRRILLNLSQLILFIYELASLYSAVSIWKDSLGTLAPCMIMLRECETWMSDEVDLDPFVLVSG